LSLFAALKASLIRRTEVVKMARMKMTERIARA